jgi:hypothetical protein
MEIIVGLLTSPNMLLKMFTLKGRSESYPKLLTTILKAICSSNGRYVGTNVISIKFRIVHIKV